MMKGRKEGIEMMINYEKGKGLGIIYLMIKMKFYYLEVRRMGWELKIRNLEEVEIL